MACQEAMSPPSTAAKTGPLGCCSCRLDIKSGNRIGTVMPLLLAAASEIRVTRLSLRCQETLRNIQAFAEQDMLAALGSHARMPICGRVCAGFLGSSAYASNSCILCSSREDWVTATCNLQTFCLDWPERHTHDMTLASCGGSECFKGKTRLYGAEFCIL